MKRKLRTDPKWEIAQLRAKGIPIDTMLTMLSQEDAIASGKRMVDAQAARDRAILLSEIKYPEPEPDNWKPSGWTNERTIPKELLAVVLEDDCPEELKDEVKKANAELAETGAVGYVTKANIERIVFRLGQANDKEVKQ